MKERVSILEETLHILESLWADNNSSVHFTGKYSKINGASMRKTATKIPITIAAKKKRMMNLAAKYADTWESSYVTPKQFSNLYAEFSEIWKYVNMNNNNKILLTKSIESDVLIAESHSELEYKKKIFAMERGPGVYNKILKDGLVCKSDSIAERVNEYTDAGIDQFVLAFQDPFDLKALELFIYALKNRLFFHYA